MMQHRCLLFNSLKAVRQLTTSTAKCLNVAAATQRFCVLRGGSYGRRPLSSLVQSFCSVDPETLSSSTPHSMPALVNGQWIATKTYLETEDPLNGGVFVKSANVKTASELKMFEDSLRKVAKSGRHNPLKNVDRYLLYGQINQKAAELLHNEDVFNFFVKCIQRVMPKSYAQAAGELKILRMFFENFSGDRVRMLCRGFTQPGDYDGQESIGYRFPYGAVGVISPFNFPLEIPVMQFMGAAMVGNKPLVKTQRAVGLPVEQFLRFLHHCGLPLDDVDFISCEGPTMSHLAAAGPLRMLQFTGSSAVADELTETMQGRVKIEDSGFDWKVMGPDVPVHDSQLMDFIAYTCDQDAYALSGQKCSAQSLLCVHSNWIDSGFLDRLRKLASRRSLKDLTCSPLLSHTNASVQKHVDALLQLRGAKILFGGRALQESHSIPLHLYGAYEPTAVVVPLKSILADEESLHVATTELFGPVQVVTVWDDADFDDVIHLLERIPYHLTAAVVSRDPLFLGKVLGQTVNGTTYAGLRARTTGAPQNHWFGPSGSPLSAGIGTPEAILSTWTCHREIIFDHGPLPSNWKIPPPS